MHQLPLREHHVLIYYYLTTTNEWSWRFNWASCAIYQWKRMLASGSIRPQQQIDRLQQPAALGWWYFVMQCIKARYLALIRASFWNCQWNTIINSDTTVETRGQQRISFVGVEDVAGFLLDVASNEQNSPTISTQRLRFMLLRSTLASPVGITRFEINLAISNKSMSSLRTDIRDQTWVRFIYAVWSNIRLDINWTIVFEPTFLFTNSQGEYCQLQTVGE